jgi:hypothetical protein
MILVWYDPFSSHGEEGIKMLEGLWSVGIGLKGTKMEGAGVIVFESQRVLGGRSNYCYTGSGR